MKVLKNKYGRGVYATRNYKKNTIVERAHVIILPRTETNSDVENSNRILPYYVFAWDDTRDAIGLGNASLYNHSKRPNLWFETDHKTTHLVFRTTRNIKKGEQLLINYGYVDMLAQEKALIARGEV